MAANAYREHLLILPEDDANREMAIGFRLELPCDPRQIQLDPIAGGWLHAVNRFENEIVPTLAKFPLRNVLLLIDCDGDPTRIDQIRTKVPQDYANRVFAMGVRTEPEDLKAMGRYDRIGESIAKQCIEGQETIWSDPLLAHNLPEARRLRKSLGSLLGL